MAVDTAPTATEADDRDPVALARSLAPLIDEEAPVTDAGGTLSPRVVSALADIGLFDLLVPRSMGGMEADVVTTLEVFEELCRADGSTGWSVLANTSTTAFAAVFLGPSAVAEMFGGEGPVIHAGMLGPAGEAKVVEGGYLVNGRYSFGSGSGHAAWIGAGTLTTKDGEFVATSSGLPELRVVFAPRSHVRFLGNWDVLGLTGTGSYDYELVDELVPEEFTFPLLDAVPKRGGPTYHLGVLGLTSIGHCGFALGVGRRALEELARVVKTKARMGGTPIRDQQLFQHDFAHQEAALRAARAYAFEVFGLAQAAVSSGREPSPEEHHRLRQATTYATRVSEEVVRSCYTWAGTSALRPGPLQRCFRDIHAGTQHIFVDNNTYTAATPVLLEGYE